MNWADPLAARTGHAVQVGVLAPDGVSEVDVVHHVFRPDGTDQVAEAGARLPAHATALGKALLAYSPSRAAATLTRFTTRTIVAPEQLARELRAVRAEALATEHGEYQPARRGRGAGRRAPAGWWWPRSSSSGPPHALLASGRAGPAGTSWNGLRDCARHISGELAAPDERRLRANDRHSARRASSRRPQRSEDAAMSARYVMAIDQGTTSTRCICSTRPAARSSVAQLEHRQFYPAPGWVEHDAGEIWRNAAPVDRRRRWPTRGAVPRDVAAVGSPTSGRPRWSGTARPAARCDNAIVLAGHPHRGRCVRRLAGDARRRGWFRRRSGLPLATYFAGPKLRWLLDNVPGCASAPSAARCCSAPWSPG